MKFVDSVVFLFQQKKNNGSGVAPSEKVVYYCNNTLNKYGSDIPLKKPPLLLLFPFFTEVTLNINLKLKSV